MSSCPVCQFYGSLWFLSSWIFLDIENSVYFSLWKVTRIFQLIWNPIHKICLWVSNGTQKSFPKRSNWHSSKGTYLILQDIQRTKYYKQYICFSSFFLFCFVFSFLTSIRFNGISPIYWDLSTWPKPEDSRFFQW